ncbi:MAG: penicillin-binding protein 2 [Clostridium sp.]|nr:penicillin-binding protein 2 [Bacteroides sp.]MCM1198884.1 penicillin-binding protein 2 [Clostridium sp.]
MKKRTGIQEENTSGKTDRVGIILMVIHGFFMVAAILLFIRIVRIQLTFEPDPRMISAVKAKSTKKTVEPERGSILAHDGRLLAASTPMYQLYMDCTVQKKAFEEMSDRQEGRKKESEWLAKARELSKGLASTFRDKSADEYYRCISNGRKNGVKYMKIGKDIDHGTLQELKKLPLFNESGYKGGLIVTKIDTRQYPYGALARRAIGHVRNNSEGNGSIGIEGKYNYVLHGKEGIEWKKLTDARQRIPEYDSTSVEVENGMDIRTTLDIDIQDIADRALRKRIKENGNIEGGCAIVMDVKTGAIRAMTNLKIDKDGEPREIYNYAIGRSGDPGSVFKLTTLMTLVEDGHVESLETMVPTYGGNWKYNKTNFHDDYLVKWRDKDISIIDAFKISSNNIFRQLACEYYEKDPDRFVKKLYEYKLAEKYDFDLEGLANPVIPRPGSTAWSGTALPSIAIGYTVNVTPLHIITFYNAVANRGKMMKPYLVESFEENGKVKKRFNPTILNGSICSKSTADTLTRALKKVTESGTGSALKNARCKIAGKTGTAQIPFTIKGSNGKDRVVYKDKDGNRMHQATFVGFFPADNPQYTAIIVFYSKLSCSNLYGAFGIPAFKTIVDEMYALNMIED